MKSTTAARPPVASNDYLRLVHAFPLRLIRDGAELEAAHAILRPLFLRDETDLSEGESDYLGALSLLAEEYEQSHVSFPRGVCSPHARLRHLMDSAGMIPADLMNLLEISQPQASLILSGKRELSKVNVKRLAVHFKLDAGYFL